MYSQSPREMQESLEARILAPKASLASKSLGREREEKECEIRTCYQRDVDRIIHSRTFRRLKHKTQVFLSPEGDHYRTRLTHTLEVARISRTVARGLRLNEDLSEAIALAHDFGHTPFGHAGERAINEVLSDDGDFKHNRQGLRIVQQIEKNGNGLNLTYEVKDGILCHTGDQLPATLEGAVVRISDRIAYINHDIDDAIRADVLQESDIPKEITDVIGSDYGNRINTLVLDLIITSERSGKIKMSPSVDAAFNDFRKFMYDNVYYNMKAKSEESKVFGVINSLFYHYMNYPDELSEEYRKIADIDGLKRAVCDYISGMTDNYAIHKYEQLFIPKAWQVL